MSQTDWIEDPELWNTVRLGEYFIPGICTVTMGKGWEIHFKKAPEKDGGTSTNKGADPGKLRIRTVMKARQWREEWLPIVPFLEPAQGKPKGPLGIAHPEPNSRNVDTVEIVNIKGLPPTAKGGIVYEIECQQWFPRPKDSKKKTAQYTTLPNRLFTTEGSDRNFDEGFLLPSGQEVLDQWLGSPIRIGTTVVEDPNNGELKVPDDD